MHVLGHIWTVVTNLVTVAIVLVMFSIASTRFETVVIVALTLIYFQVIAATTVLARQSIVASQASFEQLVSIAKNLGDHQAAEYEETLKEAERAYQQLNARYYIDVGFRTVIWLIAVWKLLAVTVFYSN